MATKSEFLAHVPPLYRLARSLKERGRDMRKRALLRDAAKRYNLRVLVETGTYMGETAWALRGDLDRIETIELEPTLARLARIRFKNVPTVQVHEGDSASVLPRILETLTEPALFWLDAHPSTDRTAQNAPIPLRAELAAIGSHPVSGHVVLVDDLHCLGTPGYPTRAEIALPGHRFEEDGGVAVLTPEPSRP